MGEKVTPSAVSEELLRAKTALDSAHATTSHAVCSASCSVPGVTPANGQPGDSTLYFEKAYLEQVFENAPEATSILQGSDFRVTRINKEFTRLFHFTPAEALGQTIQSLIVPPDRHSETAWISESMRAGNRISLETRRCRKDGTLVDVLLSVAPVLVNGKKIASYASYRDISEKKKTEDLNAALYAIAARNQSTEELHHFYAAIHNIVGQLMNARNFYIALYDPQTQLLTFPYFVDEEDPPPAPKRMSRGLTEYVIRSGESLLATPAVFDELVQIGEVELIGAPSLDWLGVPLKNGTNCFGALVVQSYQEGVRFGERELEILKFVSQQLASALEHRRYEEALRRSEMRYRSLVESAVYGIYRCTLDGRFLDVNPALRTMLGYESEEELQQLDARSEVFVNVQEMERFSDEYRRTGRLNGMEVQWKRKDGRVIIVRLSGRSVSSTAESEQVLELFAEDITERRQLEEQFRQAQKMEAVGRLAGGVAHDFNNLLMVINGYTEVLLEHLPDESGMRQKVQSIQQAADRAATLTRQLLAFSRKQLLELKVVDVNTVIQDMERLLRPLIGENIELVTRLSGDAGRIRADAGQLEQVIMNLVVNAKDAMPEGGRITLQSSCVIVNQEFRERRYILPGSYVVISVSDNGQGMEKETQSRIFEPFFTTKEKGKGTGLGLSTVYGIVKQSNGYIYPESEVGNGTTFKIYLPRVEDSAESLSATNSPVQQNAGSETVLLVEDEESVRELVRETLLSRGYKVLEAENGEVGLRIAETCQETIDILITDVVMPGIGGRELVKRLVVQRPSMRVLYLSGYTEDAVLNQGSLGDDVAFLQKPFTLQALAKKVYDVLHNRGAKSASTGA
jgi:PAS domain S-box-containing protein